MLLSRHDMYELHASRNAFKWRIDLRPLQRGMRGDPWRIAIASILLNRTHIDVVAPTVNDIFDCWPTPEDLDMAPVTGLMSALHPCGLVRRRCNVLKRFNERWINGRWQDMRELCGVGPYVADALTVFALRTMYVQSRNGVLRRAAAELRTVEWLWGDVDDAR